MRANHSSLLMMQAALPSRDNLTSKLFDPAGSDVYIIIRRVQACALPIICVFGLLANTLAIRTFLSGYLRASSCSIYLAAKCLSDNGFLLAMAVIWSYTLKVPLFNLQGVCQLTVFLTYLCSFLSVWFMAIITCENYIRIAHSWRVSYCCTASRALVVIGVFTFVAVMLNIFHFWTTSVIYNHGHSNISGAGGGGGGGGNGMCKSLHSYKDFLLTMTYVDTVLTLLLPSIFMIVLVVAILNNVLISVRRRKRLRAGTQRAHGIKRLVTPQAKMTRFLLAVSIIFLILHTPSHVIRIKMTVGFYFFDKPPSLNDHIIHRLFEMLYNLNFCNNCVIYLIFSDNFRQTFCKIFFQRFKQKDRVLSQCDRHEFIQSEMTELVTNPS